MQCRAVAGVYVFDGISADDYSICVGRCRTGAVFYCMYFGTVSALLVGVRILISLAARWNRCRQENETGKAIVFLVLFLAVLALMLYCFWDVFVAVS